MVILYILLVLLLVARVFGELAVRLGQPALVGELISGILLAVPMLLRPLLANPVINTANLTPD